MGPLPSPARRQVRVVVIAATAAALLASCSSGSDAPASASHSPLPAVTATAQPSAAPPNLTDVTFRVDVALTAPAGVDMGAASGHSLMIPVGWTAEVWAAVPDARIAAWSPDGRLVVTSADTGTVYVLSPQGEGKAPAVAVLASGLAKPQGVGFAVYQGQDVLIVGQEDAVTAWDYSDASLTNQRNLVANLPTGGHGAKGIAVDGQTVYYSLGSSGNRTPDDRTASPERAVIASVRLDGSAPRVVAHGVRNGFGLGIAPDGTLFTAVNQSDNQQYPYQDGNGQYGQVITEFVNENPKDQVTRVLPGGDLGWPFCFPDAASAPSPVGLAFVADPETNADGSRLDCDALQPTVLGLPAHSAPLDIEFTAGTGLETVLGSGALIGVHGSWNRTPPREPAVLWAPWDDATASLGESVPLVTGFQNADGSRWGRAVAAVPAPDGSLYVTDDAAGLVYRLTPPSTVTAGVADEVADTPGSVVARGATGGHPSRP